MWQSQEVVEKMLQKKLQDYCTDQHISHPEIVVIPGLEPEQFAALEQQIQIKRQQGKGTIVIGIGVMPSSLVEAVCALADHVYIASVPRLFKKAGQYYASYR